MAASSIASPVNKLFVYYRVLPATAEAAHAAVVAMQGALCAAHGLAARLLKRTEATTASETWMEIYAARDDSVDARPAPAIDDALEAAIAAAAVALEPFIDGVRHVERFETF